MSNAYLEVAHVEVTSNVAAVDLANCMSSTYDVYYLVCSNVTLDADGGYKVVGKVSNVVETVENTAVAGRASDLGGSYGYYNTGVFPTPRDFIMIQRNYNFQTALTGNNSVLEGYIFNTQSSSHNKYSIYNNMNATSNTLDRFWRYRMQVEVDNTNIYDGLYITPQGASNISSGKFTLYGMVNS